MKFKSLALGAMALMLAVALAACAPAAAPAPTATPVPAETAAPDAQAAETGATADQPEALELTVEELAAYDGKDGQPAYVAINGVIYDVTNVPQWNNGMHNGQTAGKDLTDVIMSAPHGDSVLKDLPAVGSLK